MMTRLLVALLLGAGAAQAQPGPEPRARPYSGSSSAQQADFRTLGNAYFEAFAALGLARRCGLEWEKPHDKLIAGLERRHGRDMDPLESGHFAGMAESSMSRGAQGQFGKERGALNCADAERYLAAVRLPDLPPSVVLAPGERVPARPRRSLGPNDDLIVSPTSRAVEAALRQAVTADLFRLHVAKETLRVSGDDEAAWALERYMERVALARLLDEPEPAMTGTVADAVRAEVGRDASALRAMRRKLLARALQPVFEPQPVDECERTRPQRVYDECEYLGDSVWISRNFGLVRIRIENTSGKDIAQFDVKLRLQPTVGEPFNLDCGTDTDIGKGLPRGLQWNHVCRETLERVTARRLHDAVKQARADPSRWALVPTRINFADPPIGVYPSRASYWLKTNEAWGEAAKSLRAQSCFERDSCLDELKHRYEHDPMWPAATTGAVLGLVCAFAVGLLPRRRLTVATVLSALAILALSAGLTSAFIGGNPFAAVFFAQLGAVALVAFLAVLWVTLGAVHSWRTRKGSP